jgi:hypothetical protein
MDSLSQIVHQVLSEYTTLPTAQGLERKLLVSHSGLEFWLYKMGWHNQKRIHTTTAHLEIIGGKVYIHRDESEDGFAPKLEQHGLTKAQIVLAFRSPEFRQYTEYATA